MSQPSTHHRGAECVTASEVRESISSRDRTDRNRLSRRRLLIASGAVVGFGVFGLRRRDAVDAQAARADEFNRPADALEPAVRVTTTIASETTVDTEPDDIDPDATEPDDTEPDESGDDTAVTTTTITVEDGEIMFPIVVGEDDDCWVIDNFGDCRGSGCSRRHEGVDMMADHMLPVRTPASGRLTGRYDDDGNTYGAGNGWTLFDESTDITYKFFHLDSHADGLDVDDEIEAGEVIGYVGNTGTSGANTDTNYHLHFEYRPNDVPVDLFALLQRDPNVSFAGE